MKITHELAAHGQNVIKVQFDRQSPDSDAPTVEIVYGFYVPDAIDISDDTKILIQLSITRTDTREPIQITDDELNMAREEAAEYAASLDVSDF